MTSRVVAAAEPEDQEIEIVLGRSTEKSAENKDPFLQKGVELRQFNGISANLKRTIGRKSPATNNGAGTKVSLDWDGYTALGVITPPHNLDYLAQLYEISSFNHAAVDAKVANIVGLGFDLVDSDRTKLKLLDYEDQPDKLKKARTKLNKMKVDLRELLDNISEEKNLIGVLEKIQTDFESTGNAYMEIGRTVDGRVGYIGHAPAASIRRRANKDGYVQVIGREIVFFRNYEDKTTPNPVTADPKPNELIHWYKYTPTNKYYGVPDIISAKNALAGSEFASRYNLDYFEYKTAPRYIITVKGARLSAASEQKLHEFFENSLKGKHHRSMYIPLPHGPDNEKFVDFKMEPVEQGKQDASFNAYMMANRDEMLMAHRVPINKIGLPNNVNLAAALASNKNFKEEVCNPRQDNLHAKFNRMMRLEFTDALILKLNEMTLTDEDTQSKIDERLARNQILTRNEIRSNMKVPPNKEADGFLDLKPQVAADMKATTAQSRARDANRSAGATDSNGTARNPKGEGKATK